MRGEVGDDALPLVRRGGPLREEGGSVMTRRTKSERASVIIDSGIERPLSIVGPFRDREAAQRWVDKMTRTPRGSRPGAKPAKIEIVRS